MRAEKRKWVRDEHKHGVIILSHKKWNTKKIYANGYLMVAYGKQPKHMDFHYPFINDRNQDFCGGWYLYPEDRDNRNLLLRVTQGLKPLGKVVVVGDLVPYKGDFTYEGIWTDEGEKEKEGLVKMLSGCENIKYKVSYKGFDAPNRIKYCFIQACFDTILGELVDLKKLEEVYYKSGIEIDCFCKKDKPLTDYFNGFDWQENREIQPWETGLVLGYPIENTISLYHDAIR